MKGKTNGQKGITLIALIITIVVLLILAAVAVSSITNDGILQYAQNAAKDYNQAVRNEQEMLQEYVNFLNGNGGSGGGTEEDENKDTTAPTAPTEITATAVSGSTVTLQATGGTDESGTVAGYQYSMDGTNWSETIASGTGYTTAELTNGTSWTVYAKTIDGAGNVSTDTIEYTIISFTIETTTCYAEEGMKWETLVETSYNTLRLYIHEEATNFIASEEKLGFSLETSSGDMVTPDKTVIEGEIYTIPTDGAPSIT